VQQRALKVLIVAAHREYVEQLREELSEGRTGDIDLEWAEELSEALGRLTRGGIDAVLLDLDLPDSQGMVTFDRMYAFAPDVPIVVLTGTNDENLAVSTVQGGAQDYLVHGEVQPAMLIRSVRYAIERHRLLAALRSLSLIDDLTGLYNRRGFMDLGEQYVKLARRSARGVTLVYLDLDRFKTINDSLGHHVGDRALLKVTEILKATFRRSDLLARLGGDEFAVLALEATGESAEMLVDRVRERITHFNRTGREPYQLAASIGLARMGDDPRIHLEDLLNEADRAMYEEKRGKRQWATGDA